MLNTHYSLAIVVLPYVLCPLACFAPPTPDQQLICPFSFIQALPTWNSSEGGSLALSFRTNEPDGLVLYNGGSGTAQVRQCSLTTLYLIRARLLYSILYMLTYYTLYYICSLTILYIIYAHLLYSILAIN